MAVNQKLKLSKQAYLKAIYGRLLEYRNDPIAFGVDVLGIKPENVWPKMRAVCESVRDHQLTAVPAAHSVSKTYSAGRIIVPWFKSCFQPSTVITTAPSDNQVKNQLWREIHASFVASKIPLGGTMNLTMWDCKPSQAILDTLLGDARDCWEKNFAIGFSTSPDTSAEHATKMQGWHNEHVLALLDEACGILSQIWRTVMEGLIVNQRCKVLAIGNPTDPEGEFADACRLNGKLDHLETSSEPYMSDMGWHVVPIAVMDTPNYQEGREIIPGVAGRDYEQRILTTNKKGSDGWLVRCRAAFPKTREGTYYGGELAWARKQGQVGHFPYDPSFPVFRFADFGDIWTACIDVQFIRQRVRIINDYWDNSGNATSHGGTIPVDGRGAKGCAMSMQAMPYVWGKQHYAGPDLEGSNKHSFSASGTTTQDVLRGLGFNFAAVDNVSFDEGIEAVRLLFPLLDIDEEGAKTFLEAVKGYGKIKNERLSTDEQPVFHNQPAQTWHRHTCDALRYLAVAYRFMNVAALGVYVDSPSEEPSEARPADPMAW